MNSVDMEVGRQKRPCTKFKQSVQSTDFSIIRPGPFDLVIETADNVEFRVSSRMLCAQSDYFVTLLSSGFVEEQRRLVKFEDIDSSSVETFVRFCCTGEVVVCGQTFLPLLRLASRLLCTPLVEILREYIQDQFATISDEDLSIVMTTNFDSNISELTRNLLLEHMISQNMVNLSYEVVNDILKEDELLTAREDDVLLFVKNYCKEWDLESTSRKELLDKVRLPRLTLSAFERAAITFKGISECRAFEPIVNNREFLDVVSEEQLRPRRGNNIHITMLWVGKNHNERELISIIKSLVLSDSGEIVSAPNTTIDVDSCTLAGCDYFNSCPYVSMANHVYSIINTGFLEKLTFRKGGVHVTNRPNTFGHNHVYEMDHVIGVDVDESCFYLSCLGKTTPEERVVVISCRFVQKDGLRTEKRSIPACVARQRLRRMIYRETVICMLGKNRDLLVWKTDLPDVVRVEPADEHTPKYVDIALNGDLLYVFDYSECPVHLHNFQQPFSHFDKIRIFNVVTMEWQDAFTADLNAVRKIGYNELIDFNVNMYFIRGQLYFTWMYQGRLYLFKLDERLGRVFCVFQSNSPGDANGVILLPGFFANHKETSILERYVQSFCDKKLQQVGENKLDARRMQRWREKYLDGVFGNGFFPNYGEGGWFSPVR